MDVDDPNPETALPSTSSSFVQRHGNGINYSPYSSQFQQGSGSSQLKIPDLNTPANFQWLKLKDSFQSITPSGLAISRKRQVHSQVSSRLI